MSSSSIPHATPPALADLILSGLGAPTAFVDDVLGDLHEAFHDRMATHGARAARRRYWRDVLAALPHVAREAFRSASGREVGQLFVSALSAYAILGAGSLVAGALLMGAAALVGVPMPNTPIDTGGRFWFLAWMPVVALESFAMGYVVAWWEREKPLAAAIVLGLLFALLHAAMLAIDPKATWSFTGVTTVTTLSALLAGAVARLAHRPTGITLSAPRA
jgi:membrane protease YdiL (CAAX protease family)